MSDEEDKTEPAVEAAEAPESNVPEQAEPEPEAAEPEPEPEAVEPEPEPEAVEPEPEAAEPELEAVEPEPTADPPDRKKAPRGYYIARFLIAPLLASAAVGIHWMVNVPEPEVTARNHELSTKKKHKKKKPKPRRPRRYEPRTDEQVELAWRRFQKVEFEREPISGEWARATQGLINNAVVVARREAFKGAPEQPQVAVLDTQCRTVRCRFYLRSKYEHEVGLLLESMRRLDTDGALLWRHFEAEQVGPPKESLPEEDHYVEVVVALIGDGILQRSLRVRPPEGEPGPND